MEKQNLYFIAVLLPDDLAEEITVMKEEFASRFGSQKALRVIPHITLKAPFTLDPSEHDVLLGWFAQMPIGTSSFEISLTGFGAFEKKNSPVIFIKPEENETLQSLQKEVLHTFREKFPSQVIMAPDWKYHPHITIAYRDLADDQFQLAWPVYAQKQYHAGFSVNTVHLLQHNGRNWKTIATRSLGDTSL